MQVPNNKYRFHKTFVIEQLLLTLSLIVSSLVFGQNAEFVWANSFGGTSSDVSNDIVVDSLGNVYTTGKFIGDVDFDPGPNDFILSAGISQDCFVQKLNSEGGFVWAMQNGGANGGSGGKSLGFDENGNLYVVGFFYGAIDFDPSISDTILTSNGSGDAFIQKLDLDGNLIWIRAMGGVRDESILGVTNLNGDILFAGNFASDTADFDPGVGVFNLNADQTNSNLPDIVVGKLSSNGDFLWAKSIGGEGGDGCTSITTDGSGNIYICGGFQDSVDFDPGIGTFDIITGANDYGIFIEKLSGDGDFLWVKALNNSSPQYVCSIEHDNNGDVYITGKYFGTLDFDPGPSVLEYTSLGVFDIFIDKFDSDGNLIWGKTIGGTNNDISYDINFDGQNNMYLTGAFGGTTDFDPGAGIHNLTSAGSWDIFIEKFDSNANLIWVKSFGSIGQDDGRSLVIDDFNNLYLTAFFNDTLEIDSTTADTLYSNGNRDVLIMKFDQCTLIPTVTEISNTTLQADLNGASYQWLDCNDNYTSIVSENDQVFIASQNGFYALEVSHNGCIDTSSCYVMNDVDLGFEEQNTEGNWSIFPIPASKKIEIVSDGGSKTIWIHDVFGKLKGQYIFENSIKLDIGDYPPGVYIVKMESSDGWSTRKILVYR